MEKVGHILRFLKRVLKVLLRIGMYLLWFAFRTLEMVAKHVNMLLEYLLTGKQKRDKK